MKKIILRSRSLSSIRITLLLFTVLILHHAVLAAAGSLDTGFGTAGKVFTQFGTSQDEGRAIAIQPDGKIVVAGFMNPGFFNYDIAVARYNADGSLDTGFGNSGKVTINIGTQTNGNGTVDAANALVLLSDGSMLVAGQTTKDGNGDFVVVKLQSNGVIPANFGIGGIVKFNAGTNSDSAYSIVEQPDGKILVGGDGGGPTVVKLNSDGSVDTTFGTSGRTTVANINAFQGTAMVLHPNGNIIIAGTSVTGNTDVVLMRLSPIGVIDPTFGFFGTATVTFSTGNDYPHALAVQSDGKILVFGDSHNGSNRDFAVARFSAAGALDTTFDTDGMVTTPISTLDDIAFAGVVQPDGKIIAAGRASNGVASDPNFALVRYNSNGSLDTTFGTGGKVTTAMSFNDNDDVVYGVGLQADGKIVAAGQSNSLGANTAQDFALARYLGVLPCSVTLTPTSKYFPSSGGPDSIIVGNPQFCNWSVTVNDPWITIPPPLPGGNGPGNIQYSVAANPNPVERTGSITIGDKTFVVIQAPSGCISTFLSTTPIQSGATGSVMWSPGVNLNQMGVVSFDSEVTFDPAVVTFASVDNAATQTAGFILSTNVVSPGVVRISGFGTSPMPGNGNGPILYLRFTATGAIGASTPITFANLIFNEGLTCVGSLPGSVSVSGRSISGTISYGTAQTTLGLGGLYIDAVGGNPGGTAITAADGTYSISGLNTGGYIVSPRSVTPTVNGITAGDASLVLQHVTGNWVLTPNQLIAADASGNGGVSSFDAALIAKYTIGLPNTVFTGSWKFAPSLRTYPSLPTDLTGQDFALILVGEVTGNWTPAGLLGNGDWLSSVKKDDVEDDISTRLAVSIPTVVTRRNSLAEIPIDLSGYNGQRITSYQFDLKYDPAALDPAEIGFDKAGTLSSEFSVEINQAEPGRLRLAVYGANTLIGDGRLIKLRFMTTGTFKGTSNIEFENFMFNEGLPQSRTTNGKIVVTGGPVLTFN